MDPILQLILKVSKVLQNPAINLLVAVNEVENLCSALQNLHNDEKFYDETYKSALTKCEELNIKEFSVKIKKIAKRFDQNSGNQHVFKTKKDEIRVFVFFPLLDTLIQGIEHRFNQETISIITTIGKMLKLNFNKEEISLLSTFFEVSERELESEIRLLSARNKECVHTLVTQDCLSWLNWMKKNEVEGIYINFIRIIKDFCVIPVTSASCERAFSKLTHVKTKLRATMKQDRLDDFMLAFMEQQLEKSIDVEDIIEEFKKLVPFDRRLTL